MEIYKIGEVRAAITKILGDDITEERLRRYEENGLIKFNREDKTEFRTCTPEMLEEIVNTVLLIETGLPIDTLKNKDVEAVKSHIATVKKITPKLHIPTDWR